MKNRPWKMFAASLVALVFLSYSTAWAVLGCLHDGDPAHAESIVGSALSQDHAAKLPSAGHVHGVIDCTGLNCHVEFMAEPTLPAQLDHFTTEFRPVSSEFHHVRIVAGETPGGFAPGNAYYRRSALKEFSDLPLYLSLAVFRI